jgi:hypothetical protein
MTLVSGVNRTAFLQARDGVRGALPSKTVLLCCRETLLMCSAQCYSRLQDKGAMRSNETDRNTTPGLLISFLVDAL